MASDKKSRLREARINAGFKTTAAAAERLGVGVSTYRAHENGQNDFDDEHAIKYAKSFKVDPAWLMFDVADQRTKSYVGPAPSEASNAVVGDVLSGDSVTIPLYGHAVGGLDGEFVLNGSKLDDITAPPSLSGVSGAYAVTVAGDSMEPRYEDGETVFVDPTRRVMRGNYVIAQIQTKEDGPLLAYVKRFIRHNATELVLEQLNPPKELKFPHGQVVSVDYIVMGGRVV